MLPEQVQMRDDAKGTTCHSAVTLSTREIVTVPVKDGKRRVVDLL